MFNIDRPYRRRIIWNTIANYSGRTVSAVLNVVFVPAYVRLLGVEAYGLVGLFAVIQGLMQLFDLGLSTTLNRELAQLSDQPAQDRERADLVKTFETIYWAIGILIALALCALAPHAAGRWLHPGSIQASKLTSALILIAIVIGVNWPIGLYSGGLLGLERHVLLNTVNGVSSVVRYVGAFIVLLFISKSVISYFAWQLAASTVQVLYLRFLLRRETGCVTQDGRFRASIVNERARLILGISGTYLALISLNQVDKLVVGRLVSLEEFGYYTISWTAVSVAYFFYSPISAALYPRITNLCGQSLNDRAVHAYELGSQLTAVLVFPVMAIFSVFSREIMTLWIARPEIVEHTHLLVRYLAPSVALTSLLSISNMLQWAHGWTAVGFWTNLAAAIVMVPCIAFATHRNGILGAVIACSSVRIVQALVQLEMTHEHYFPARKANWYRDLVLTALISTATALAGKYFLPEGMNKFQMASTLVTVWVFATALAVWVPSSIRCQLTQMWRAQSVQLGL